MMSKNKKPFDGKKDPKQGQRTANILNAIEKIERQLPSNQKKTMSYYLDHRKTLTINDDLRSTIFDLAKNNYKEAALLFAKPNRLTQNCITDTDIAELLVIHYEAMMQSVESNLGANASNHKEKAKAFYQLLCTCLMNSGRVPDKYFEDQKISRILAKEPAIASQIALALAKDEPEYYARTEQIKNQAINAAKIAIRDDTDLYKILDIEDSRGPEKTLEQITSQYKKLIRKYSPNTQENAVKSEEEKKNLTAKIQEIKNAFEILKNEEARQLYDQHYSKKNRQPIYRK